jgi:hypothetical protein
VTLWSWKSFGAEGAYWCIDTFFASLGSIDVQICHEGFRILSQAENGI